MQQSSRSFDMYEVKESRIRSNKRAVTVQRTRILDYQTILGSLNRQTDIVKMIIVFHPTMTNCVLKTDTEQRT